MHSGNWAAQKPFTQPARGGDQPGAPNGLSPPAPGQPALPTPCAGQEHETKLGFPSAAQGSVKVAGQAGHRGMSARAGVRGAWVCVQVREDTGLNTMETFGMKSAWE